MFSNLKALCPICPDTRIVKECPEAKKKESQMEGKERRTTEWQSLEYMHALLLII